jgi:ribosome recycling factor
LQFTAKKAGKSLTPEGVSYRDVMTTIATTKDAMAQARTRMEKAVDDFRKELATLRTGRANASILDNIRVDYHGTPMPVNQLGTVTVPEATLLVISPWDPSVVPLIDKAIRTSDLGLNPTNDGKVVRVPMPSPTEERRKEIVKHLHKVLENHRTAVRNIRRDIKEAIDKLEKDKKISQDEHKRAIEEMEKVTHSETKKIEDLSAAKEKEILELR